MELHPGHQWALSGVQGPISAMCLVQGGEWGEPVSAPG